MNGHRWFDPHQPQTLQIATLLLYLNGVFALLAGAYASAWGLAILGASVGGAFGMANAKKWGYYLALFAAAFPFILTLAYGSLFDWIQHDVINFMFAVALVALLVHPMSRNYQKIWFS